MTARAFIVHSFWIGFLMALLGIAAGVLIVAPRLGISDPEPGCAEPQSFCVPMTEPNCPTEDSCSVQYYEHEWHITEDGR